MDPNRLIPSMVLDRMVNAVELVRRRLLRASSALKGANVPYAIVGGNAIAAWVATIDQAAVRNTQDVDVVIRRADFASAKASLEASGFVFPHTSGLDVFLDGADSSPRQGMRLVFAQELVRVGEPAPNPDVSESQDLGPFRVLNLDALVKIKLTAFRDKDRTHVRDLIEVGLVDQTWVARLPGVLGERLQGLLDTPDG